LHVQVRARSLRILRPGAGLSARAAVGPVTEVADLPRAAPF
jgi:hypothetical protein